MECLAAAAIALDMRVEQNGLGLGICSRVFYEVKARAFFAQRDARRTHKRPGAVARGRQAICG